MHCWLLSNANEDQFFSNMFNKPVQIWVLKSALLALCVLVWYFSDQSICKLKTEHTLNTANIRISWINDLLTWICSSVQEQNNIANMTLQVYDCSTFSATKIHLEKWMKPFTVTHLFKYSSLAESLFDYIIKPRSSLKRYWTRRSYTALFYQGTV